jgi:hypothetical protein
VGLFAFAQTITLLGQIAVLQPVPRRLSYLAVSLLLAGILFGAVRLLIAYARLRLTQKITLRGIDILNERVQLRQLVADETEQAFQVVLAHLDEYYKKPHELNRIGFNAEQAAELLKSRLNLIKLVNRIGPGDWLKLFRQDFQSIVDQAADACIKRHALGVGVKVAGLPIALVETAVVLHGGFTMIGELCEIYRLRPGASRTLIVTGWVAIQGLIAGRVDEWTGNEAESWKHQFDQHFAASEAVVSSAHEVGAETIHGAAGAVIHTMGDVPFAGRLLKRVAKGSVQSLLLWRLGRLAQRWLRMVE